MSLAETEFRNVRGRARCATAVALAILAAAAPRASARSPNVVLIVADDLGYSDLGSYGGEIDTPELDRLALAGVRFSHFYATPRCSPSRAALLTGVWPHEAGVGHLNRDWGANAYRGAIHDAVPTLAERLRGAGYATYMVGKWHLTPDLPDLSTAVDGATSDGATRDGAAPGDGGAPPPERQGQEAPGALGDDRRPPSSWPLQRGFDVFYGTLGGSGSYFQPPYLIDGNDPAPWPPRSDRTVAEIDDAAASGADAYLTDALGTRAASLVQGHLDGSPERPFFLYLAFTAPHWPLHAPQQDIERYRGRFDAGWDELAEERLERMKEIGMVPADAELPVRDPRVPAWNDAPDHAWQARRMEVYAAMVSALDRAVGRVVEALDAAGALDDTLLVFLSDNGACAEELRGIYALTPLFVPVPQHTADGQEVRFGDRPDVLPGPPDTFAAYGRGWARLSSTPLRGYKTRTHEGGISVPFFAHWPARLRRRAGAIVDAPAHVVDLVPTLLEIARAEVGDAPPPAETDDPPRGADGEQGGARVGGAPAPLRGSSLLPLLDGAAAGPRTLYWEHEGNRAVEKGEWKLVSRWPFGWELYDLSSDRAETDDLAASQADRAADLERLWDDWAAAVGVEPWPLVVPQVRTALTVVAGLLVVASAVRRLVRRRRSQPPGPTSARPSRPMPESPPPSPPAPDPGPPAPTRPPPPIHPV